MSPRPSRLAIGAEPLTPIAVPDAFGPVITKGPPASAELLTTRSILLPSAAQASADLRAAQARGATAAEIARLAARAERAAARETAAELARQQADASPSPPPPPLPGAPAPRNDDGTVFRPLPPLPAPPAADPAADTTAKSRSRSLLAAGLILAPALLALAFLHLPSKR